MRTNTFVVAAVLAAAAFSAGAAENRWTPTSSPFTYDALGATPTLTFGRATSAAPAKAVEAPTAAPSRAAAPNRTTGMATGTTPFTYDTLGATPHVDVKKPVKTETLNPAGR
jgi:hypothetical protein